MALHVTVLRSLEELRAFLPEWRAFLRTEQPAASFYQDPAVVELFLEQHRKSAQPRLLVVRQGERIVGIAPCYVERSRYRMRLSVLTLFCLPVRRLRIFGDAPLLGRNAPDGVLETILAAIRDLRRELDVIYLETLALEGDFARALREAGAGDFRMMVTSPETEVVRRLRFGVSFEEYLASRTKKTRKNLNWQLKKWEREAPGPAELVCVTDPEQVPEFVEVLDRVFRKTWQARTFGQRSRNDAATREHFERVARLGWLRSYLLHSAGQPIAFVVGYQYGGVYHYDETGYDQDHAALGPGTVLNYHMLEDLFARQKPEVLDFGHGENLYKKVLGTEEVPVCAAYVVPRNRWRPVLVTQQLLNRVYVGVRGALVRHGFDAAVRRALKRKPAATAGEA